MAPNAAIGNQYGTLAQAETFLMTNMCPQHRSLNRGQWQALEAWIPEMAQDTNHIYVICGPIFGDDPEITERGPERGIQIPEAFYMILVDPEREWQDRPTISLMAYRFPQNMPAGADFRDRDAYGVSVAQIEALTNLDFFPLYTRLFTNWAAREAEVEDEHWETE
jgi:endonuclease G